MTRRLVAAVAALLVAALALPCVAVAQDEKGPISWIAVVKTKPGKSRELNQHAMQNDKAMYDKLLAEGHILSWGMAIPINHRQDDTWNHFTWVTTADWAGIGHLQRGFESMFESMGPEKMKAANELFAASTYEGSHADWLIRHLVLKAEDGGKSNYFYFGYWTAKPGKAGALEALYKAVAPKAYDPLVASGKISGYGLATNELHGEGFTHITWVAMEDLSGVDAFSAAIEKSVTQEQLETLGEITVPGTHSDQVLLIVHNSRNESE